MSVVEFDRREEFGIILHGGGDGGIAGIGRYLWNLPLTGAGN